MIAEAEVKSEGIEISMKPLLVTKGMKASIRAVIRADDLREHLERTKPGGLAAFNVTMEADEITVTGVTKLLIPVQVGARGRLVFSNARLEFVPERAEVAGVPAPEGMVREQLDKINPILDLSELPLEVSDPEFRMQNGFLTVRATIMTSSDFG